MNGYILCDDTIFPCSKIVKLTENGKDFTVSLSAKHRGEEGIRTHYIRLQWCTSHYDIPVIEFVADAKPVGIDPIFAWFDGQLVQIISVYGNEESRMFYGFCDICGAQPYGIIKCDEKLHRVREIQDKIAVLRKKTTILEKDCQNPTITREGLNDQIETLKGILKLTIDTTKL
ncbi:Hypothetical predicted protein [Paramuricea clavata]|uniref:Uncharacterized protein n=1 Tax=Paramuricea clavata TaxID=317549 RepID=A0A7D9HAF4_PARCT|nr:Hypothetical predicted protein [Paramuricea clavata]